MAQNSDATDEAEQYRQSQIESAREMLESSQDALDKARAFKTRVEDASSDDLREMFGDVMADARSHHRDVVEARLWLDEDGTITKLASVPMDSRAYWDGNADLTFRVACDSFLGYDDVEAAARYAAQQSIDGASLNVEDAEKQLSHFQ